jgi:hypothetical protein
VDEVISGAFIDMFFILLLMARTLQTQQGGNTVAWSAIVPITAPTGRRVELKPQQHCAFWRDPEEHRPHMGLTFTGKITI